MEYRLQNSYTSLKLTNSLLLSFSNYLKELKQTPESTILSEALLKNQTGGKKLHVLIADDDADDKELFVEALTSISPEIRVMMVGNGKELITKLHSSELPDIVFLDLNMPTMNGFECLDVIKSDAKLKDLPVIIYSTSANPDQIEKTYIQGANLYIKKPNSFIEIKLLLKRIMDFSVEQFFTQPSRKEFLLKSN